MEFHCLPTFFSLNLMLMIAHAALTPRLYWETMLPSTPMPKAITELLSLEELAGGGNVSKGHMHMLKSDDQLQDDSVVHIYDGQDELFFRYANSAKEIPPLDSSSVTIYHTAEETQLHDHQSHEKETSSLFFSAKDLRVGNKLNIQFNSTKPAVPLLSRQISQRIPFSLDKMEQALEMLCAKPTSRNAETMARTVGYCEAPSMDGERKHCATSLESMVDFVASALGRNVGAFSTEPEKETESQKFVVKGGVKRLGDDKVIACHPMSYPYLVFVCHEVQKTSAYLVPLEGEDGVRVKAIAACHRDTSKWDPNHVAFKVLNAMPGNGTVCHIFPKGHLLWLPNK
ncbi:Dehydration-responsive protein RD22 [Spatholobus suberectus]|nr:Dehydration-responsive protein RD22 [Spatholobus suberectus]